MCDFETLKYKFWIKRKLYRLENWIVRFFSASWIKFDHFLKCLWAKWAGRLTAPRLEIIQVWTESTCVCRSSSSAAAVLFNFERVCGLCCAWLLCCRAGMHQWGCVAVLLWPLDAGLCYDEPEVIRSVIKILLLQQSHQHPRENETFSAIILIATSARSLFAGPVTTTTKQM